MDKIAVLIPCYNEALTIEKVVRDWKAALPEAVIYVYITIPRMTPLKSQPGQVPLSAMNTSRVKAM